MNPRLYTCASLLLLTIPCVVRAQTVHTYQTNSDLTRKLAAGTDANFAPQSSPAAKPADLVITVDDKERFQVMDGFGASMTDGSAWLLHDRIPAQLRTQVMQQLFDPSAGIGLSVLRQPIASSDLSRDHYSFDDMPAGQRDPKLKHFSTKHDDSYVFPMVREALQLNPSLMVIATPWSPPGWMKTADSMNGGSLRDDAMQVYAAYLVRSLQSFKEHGVPVKYLTVQNEPLHETKDFPGTLMLAAQAKQLIGKYLGPDLKREGLDTQILAYDHNWDHPEYPLEILSDAAAAPYVAGSALHCYGGDASAQQGIHARYPEKGIWLTECSGGTWQKESPLLTTTHLLMDTTRNWAKSVVLWGIALDTEHNPHAGGCGTCRGLVTLDLHASVPTATYTGDFYALGHASRFVRPGATRISSSSYGRESLETVAFQNVDGSIALLVLNNTAEEKNFQVSWRGNAIREVLPSGTLATYVWRPSM